MSSSGFFIALKNHPAPPPLPPSPPSQFVGTFQDVQEMEDFGELDAALTPKK